MFRSRGLSTEEAADLAQDVCAKTIVHLRRHGQRAENLGPLMMTIARNALIERARLRRPALVSLHDAESVADPHQDPAEAVATLERRTVVRRALRELTPKQRRAMTLLLDGAGPAEIADRLGIERNAADALLHRARKRMGQVLASMRDGLWGVAGLPLVRVRSWARKAEFWLAGPGGSAFLPSLTASAAAIAVAGTIAVGGATPGSVSDAVPVSSSKPAAVVASESADPRPGSAGPVSEAPAEAPETVVVDADAGDRRLGAAANGTDPATGEDETLVGIEVWHEEEEARRGATGPVVDQADALCGAGAGICGEGGR